MTTETKSYARFTRAQRLEHAILLLTFTTLSITGLPQKYPDTVWGSWMIQAMGGIEFTRVIHHACAVLLIAASAYHLGVIVYRIWVRRVRLTMLPSWQDVIDAVQTLAYNVRFLKNPPRMGRFTFGEKVEYWAVIWGTAIMILTGFMLWNPIATTNIFPGQFIPAAKAAHGGEALLAVLSIITWHFYNVHLKHFNKSMFTGKITHHEMVEEHPRELAEIEAGEAALEPDPVRVKQRQRIFYPIAAILSVAVLVGLYIFVTYEETAITTVPRQEIEIFVPLTPTSQP